MHGKAEGISGWTLLFGILGPGGALLAIPAMGIEYGIRKGIDQRVGSSIDENLVHSYIENRVAVNFLEILKKNIQLSKIEYIPNTDQNQGAITALTYDAKIMLYVKKISIERTYDDYFNLYVTVQGTMENLKSDEILWDREENLKSREPKRLDYYKSNGIIELNTLLEKSVLNLAYDFIYLK